jgi:hypothetical protein
MKNSIGVRNTSAFLKMILGYTKEIEIGYETTTLEWQRG